METKRPEGGTKWSSELLDSVRQTIEHRDFLIPLTVYSDPEIFEMEKSRLFSRAWCFLAHQSEIPNPGDYVVRYIVDDAFIVVRGEEGQVRVLFDSCRHRGMQVCRAERGNASHFRCPYHGWTYRNTGELTGVPFQKDAYGEGNIDKGEWGLLPIPQFDTYNGLIFGNLDSAAPSLDEYLGDYKWYLDFQTKRSEAGLEVLGSPQRFVVPANWKLAAENFIGDAYHTPTSHRSVTEVGLMPGGDPNFRKQGVHYNAGVGGGGMLKIPPGNYLDLPPSVVESMKRSLTPEHMHVAGELGYMPVSGTLFPNLSFIAAPAMLDEDSPPVPFFGLRSWRPIAPDKMEIVSWCVVDKDAPESYKRASSTAYTRSFGTSGMFEQDDTENWANITRVAKGQLANRQLLNFRMGLDSRSQPATDLRLDWPGPGNAYAGSFAEFNQRLFWRTWLHYLTGNEEQ